MEIIKITPDNISELKSIYSAFCKNAKEDYLFEAPPIPFQDFMMNFKEGFIEGYLCKNPTVDAFLLYTTSLGNAIEITLLYTRENTNNYVMKNALLERFLTDIKQQYSNSIISYPMLGVQNDYAQDITNIGFKLVGEMIVEFNFSNPISHVLLSKADVKIPQLPFNIDRWQDVYLDDAAECLCQEFSQLNDVKFDPRFLTIDGSKEVLECITKGYYGKFLPQATTVLRHEHKPIGYCFVNLTADDIANIPLIYISKEYKQQGLGAFILKNSVTSLKNAIADEQLAVKVVNATCDTDNFPAVRTYRKLGFKEKNYYAHAYYNL